MVWDANRDVVEWFENALTHESEEVRIRALELLARVDGPRRKRWLDRGLDDTSPAVRATAALVWRCFDGVGTIEEIAHDLAAAFDLPAEIVRDDVLALTRELAACGLVAGVEPSEDGRALLLHRRGGQVRRG